MYVVDVHIPDSGDFSPPQPHNEFIPPAGAFAGPRSSSPLTSNSLGAEGMNSRLKRLPQESALSVSAVSSCDQVGVSAVLGSYNLERLFEMVLSITAMRTAGDPEFRKNGGVSGFCTHM